MKKIIFPFLCFSLLLVSCATSKEKFVKIEPGKAIITNIDKEKSAVKYNQTVDGFKNVTVVDCSKSKARNYVPVNLVAYSNSEVELQFSCDIKIEDSKMGTDLVEISWVVNEVTSKNSSLVHKRIPVNEWVHLSGKQRMSLGPNRSFYISGSGENLDKENQKICIKDFNLVVCSENIGKKDVKAVSWKDEPSLAKAYEQYFDYIGFATPLNGVLDNPEVVKGLSYQASCFTMENEFKPDFIFAWQQPKNFVDFIAEDGKSYKVPSNTPLMDNVGRILKIARDNNLKMRGHVLVWHSQTPEWFFKSDYANSGFADEATMNARMEWYIKTVLEYIRNWEEKNNDGKRIVITWDVVNEAASDNAGPNNWLRTESPWYKIYQSDRFIVNAFRYANKYAPKDVLLAYNDYGCASFNKCGAILKIVEAIQASPDARIDVVGMQSHIGMNTAITGNMSFETSVKRFLEKGVDVQITELDIGQDGQSYNSEFLKNKYQEFFQMCLDNRKTGNSNGIRGITLWGIIDERSWIYKKDDMIQHPLLFEKDYVCKPAFYGVLEAAEEK